MTSTSDRSHEQRPGRLVSLLLNLSTREVEVRHVEAIDAHFRLITLEGEELRCRQWTPGDMVQIILSGATLSGPWELRSYTPLAFDSETGTTKVLGYVHRHGPGSDWFASVRAGTRCRIVGPRHALSLPKATRPVVFFGDETSFGTAIAMRETPAGHRDVHFVFEVNSIAAAQVVVGRFGMGGVTKLVVREEGERHLAAVERETLRAYRETDASHGVLTGNARSIQRLYKALKAAGVPGRRLINVAYWAPGKKAL
jgi:NADPH-dependent ferric siderophore reductase